jgi:DNA-binding transcriptional ArsR family regulator
MDAKKIAKIMKALSNEKRFSLFYEIAQKKESDFQESECFISYIISLLKISAPTISHHIKELSNAGLIITEKKGKYLTAKIDKTTIGEIINIFSEIKDK